MNNNKVDKIRMTEKFRFSNLPYSQSGQVKFWVLPAIVVVGALIWFFFGSTPSRQVIEERSVPQASTSVDTPEVDNPFAVGSVAPDTQPVQAPKIDDSGVVVIASTPQELDGPPIASMLEGTQIDGQLQADQNGDLILDLSVRDFFEYFLNTQVDVGINAAMAEIMSYAENYLPATARDQVSELLDKYVEYKTINTSLMNTPLDTDDSWSMEQYSELMRASFAQLKDAQQSIFGQQVSEVLFGPENAYAEYSLKAMDIQNNPDLSPEERTQLLDYNRNLLPEEMFRTEAGQQASRERDVQVKQILDQAKSSDEAIESLQELGFNKESAAALLEWQASQKTFESRYSTYRQEREQLRSSGLQDDELLARLVPIRERYFDNSEQITQAHLQDLKELGL